MIEYKVPNEDELQKVYSKCSKDYQSGCVELDKR